MRKERSLTGTYSVVVCDRLAETVEAWCCQTHESPSSAGAHPLRAGQECEN